MATKKVILKEIVDGVVGDSIYPQTSKDMVEGLEEALDAAGSVSTISVNGGTPLQPDENKNINITVPEDLVDLGEDSTHQTVTAAQKTEWSNKSTFSGNYNDLTNKPTIPAAVTESTVSGWGFTKNTGTYSKPSGGIPSTDLASAVQTSLGKADTAIQSVTVGTTTTGAAGSFASVTNSGTATAPVLDFTIPQGEQGVKGDTVIMGNEDSYTLYNVTGNAVDGAMTQQAVTRELEKLQTATTTPDFAISDEYGNEIVQFSEGHLKTKNFDSSEVAPSKNELFYDFSIADENGNSVMAIKDGDIYTMKGKVGGNGSVYEYDEICGNLLGEVDLTSAFIQGGIASDGSEESSQYAVRTPSITPSSLASYLYIGCSAHYTVHLFQYDSNTLKDVKKYVYNTIIPLIGDTYRLVVRRVEDNTAISVSDISNAVLDVKEYGKKKVPNLGTKRPYTSQLEFFKVMVDQIVPKKYTVNKHTDTWTSDIETSTDIQPVSGVIALPPNYEPNGKPCRLIMLAHGGSGYVGNGMWYPSHPKWLNETLEMLTNAGYAVYDCNGVADYTYDSTLPTKEMPFGYPVVIESYYRSYLYIQEHYNVERGVYIWAGSQGGMTGLNFPWCHDGITNAVAMMAGMCSLYYMYWSDPDSYLRGRVLCATRYDFTNKSGDINSYEADKVGGFDPYTRIKTIDGSKYVLGWNTPIKFFYGTADENLEEYWCTDDWVEAMQNSGVNVDVRWFQGFDHDAVAIGDNPICVREAIAYFNKY